MRKRLKLRRRFCGKRRSLLRPKGHKVPCQKASSREISAEADPDECGDPSDKRRIKAEAYRYQRGAVALIAVWGRSPCFCSPTGNCSFWLYRSEPGHFFRLLQTYMVREFGFLRSKTHGLPDLVPSSHDSAQTFPGALWKFDGSEYIAECGWQILTTYEDVPVDVIAKPIDSRVEKNTCQQKLLPQRELLRRK